jgi:hypothetical protein
LETVDVAEAVFQAFRFSSVLAQQRSVATPQTRSEDRWEFEGWSEGSCSVVGLEAAGFDVTNYKRDEQRSPGPTTMTE